MDTIRYMLFAPLIVTAYLAGKRALGREPKPLLRASTIVFACIATPTLIQFALPDLYNWLACRPTFVINGHEYWRLLTAITVQDGGVIGAIFNLITLFFTLQIAEPVWGKWRMIGIFLAGAVSLNLVAVAFATETAGNSGATFLLLASVVGYTLTKASLTKLKQHWQMLTCLAIAILLAFMHDAHGYVFLCGTVIGLLLKLGASRGREKQRSRSAH